MYNRISGIFCFHFQTYEMPSWHFCVIPPYCFDQRLREKIDVAWLHKIQISFRMAQHSVGPSHIKGKCGQCWYRKGPAVSVGNVYVVC